jgi:predicted RNase H-like HicB family nuclease
MRYAVMIEKGESNFSAYVPDLPGSVSVGDTLQEVKAEIREAIAFHLEGMREDGAPIPPPSTKPDCVEAWTTVAVMAWLVPAIHAEV